MDMKEKKIENFLNLLDSPAIQKKIRDICDVSPVTDSKSGIEVTELKARLAQCQNEMQEYKNSFAAERSRLESDLKKAKEKLETSKKTIEEREDELSQLRKSEQSLSSSLEKANEDIRKLKNYFSDSVTLLDRYKSLSVSIRTGLSDVICDKDVILFIASCSTPEHLKAIWTYTKKMAGSNGDADEIDVLKDIFDYFFDVFNHSLQNPMYVRDSVETGYSFDDDKYDRCTGSSTSGKITQVILRGYKSVNTGTIICRSFVRV